MINLSHYETRHLQAAEGWLELGLYEDAIRELEQLQPPADQCPQALLLKTAAFYAASKWQLCLDAALQLIQAEPELGTAYVNASIALYRLHRTQDAWNLLHPVLEKLNATWLIPYNLACYAAQLGQPEEAFRMYALALGRGEAALVKEQALRDPDLKPIWGAIKETGQ